MCSCTYMRVTLGEGRGNQLEGAILFFGRCSCNEGLLYQKVKDIELGLRGLFNWARKPAQIDVSESTVQEGHQAIADAVMERKTKAREPGHIVGMTNATWAPVQCTTLKSRCEAWKKRPLMRK